MWIAYYMTQSLQFLLNNFKWKLSAYLKAQSSFVYKLKEAGGEKGLEKYTWQNTELSQAREIYKRGKI